MKSGREEMAEYLGPGPYMDSDHEAVVRFATRVVDGIRAPGTPGSEEAVEGIGPPGTPGPEGSGEGEVQGSGWDHREKAVALYYAVRDEIRYDPYRIDLRPDAMRASSTLARGYGFCIAKAVLLGAAARVHGIPARLGFADVRNHLTTERLRRSMGTDIFVYHGYADLYIHGKWVKATPAFNRALCLRFGAPTLDFDGIHDSVFQPFDGEGNRYMEYLKDHGTFAELPLDDLRGAFETAYPALMSGGKCDLSGRFEDDAAAER